MGLGAASCRPVRVFHLLLALATSALVYAKPSQYCRSANKGGADFCAAMSFYQNRSSSSLDLYLTMALKRPLSVSAANGWTAIGTGPTMAGSLMFVLYGDPESSATRQPVVSVRTVDSGHGHPQQLARAGTGRDVDVQLLQAAWLPSDGSSSGAQMSVVCYGFSRWHGSTVSAASASQTWIWAWNDKQDMRPYSSQAELQGHSPIDGYGSFYVDVRGAAVDDDSSHWPPIPSIDRDAQSASAATSEHDASQRFLNLLGCLHGFLMTVPFLLLFPLGAVAMTRAEGKAFTHHWIIQATAMLLAVAGAVVGLFISMRHGATLSLSSAHQVAGLAICACLMVQAWLGVQHHRDWLRIHRRTSVSHGHIWLGRLLLIAGWGNALGGFISHGPSKMVTPVAILVVLEAAGVCCAAYVAARRRREEPRPSSCTYQEVAPGQDL